MYIYMFFLLNNCWQLIKIKIISIILRRYDDFKNLASFKPKYAWCKHSFSIYSIFVHVYHFFRCCRHGWEYIKCAAESLDPLKCNADSIYGAVTVLMQANRSFFDRINPGRGEEVYSCINSKSTILNTYLRVWDF